MVHYVLLEEVLALHEQSINRYGGSHGVRELGLIESAIARPQAGFGDFEAYPDLFLKVAVLGHSLLKNHAFVDGNKRTAIASMELFLYKNGFTLKVKDYDLYNLALNIENNSLPEDKIATWLKKHSRKI